MYTKRKVVECGRRLGLEIRMERAISFFKVECPMATEGLEIWKGEETCNETRKGQYILFLVGNKCVLVLQP